MDTFQEQLSKAVLLNPHLRSQTNSGPNSTPCSESDHSENMIRLWVVMTETFGYKWFKPMGEEPNQTWISALRNLTASQWRDGLNMLKASTDEWPPSLPEFKRWCTGEMNAQQLKAYAEIRASEILEKEQGSYNPFRTPLTHDQYDKQYAKLVRQIMNSETENTRRLALGLDREKDPRRICQDEELR